MNAHGIPANPACAARERRTGKMIATPAADPCAARMRCRGARNATMRECSETEVIMHPTVGP